MESVNRSSLDYALVCIRDGRESDARQEICNVIGEIEDGEESCDVILAAQNNEVGHDGSVIDKVYLLLREIIDAGKRAA